MAQRVIYEWNFGRPGSIVAWKTEWLWEPRVLKGEPIARGTVRWTQEYDGAAHLHVSGISSALDFWTELPVDLRFGDVIEVTFIVERGTHPIGGLTIIVGRSSAG